MGGVSRATSRCVGAALVAVVICAAVAVAAVATPVTTTYAISRDDGGAYSAQRNGAAAPAWSGPPVASADGQTLSVNSGQSVWYTAPPALPVDAPVLQAGALNVTAFRGLLQRFWSLAAALNGTDYGDGVVQLTPSGRTFALRHADDLPYRTVFGVTSATFGGSSGSGSGSGDDALGWVCNRTLPTTRTAYQCWALSSGNATTPADVVSAFAVSVDHRWSDPLAVTVAVPSSLSAAVQANVQNEWQALAVAEHSANAREMERILEIVQWNEQRRADARVAVGFLWLFIAITFFCVICTAAAWQSWYAPYIDCECASACVACSCARCCCRGYQARALCHHCNGRCMHVKHAALIWCGASVVVTAVVMATAGLMGFFVMLVIFVLWSVFINVHFWCAHPRTATDRTLFSSLPPTDGTGDGGAAAGLSSGRTQRSARNTDRSARNPLSGRKPFAPAPVELDVKTNPNANANVSAVAAAASGGDEKVGGAAAVHAADLALSRRSSALVMIADHHEQMAAAAAAGEHTDSKGVSRTIGEAASPPATVVSIADRQQAAAAAAAAAGGGAADAHAPAGAVITAAVAPAPVGSAAPPAHNGAHHAPAHAPHPSVHHSSTRSHPHIPPLPKHITGRAPASGRGGADGGSGRPGSGRPGSGRPGSGRPDSGNAKPSPRRDEENARPASPGAETARKRPGYDRPWGIRPAPMGVLQKRWVWGLNIAVLCSFSVVIMIVGIWRVDEYYLVDRASGAAVVEVMPQTLAKTVAAAYVFDGWADILQLNSFFLPTSTEYCGKHFSQTLTSDSDKYDKIQRAFIDKYQVDMSIYRCRSYACFTSVNDWFTRHLRDDLPVRPLSPGTADVFGGVASDDVISSPADARVVTFSSVPNDQRIWLKGESFDSEKLLGYRWDAFDGGAMAIVRLAPQDYHHFHAPCNGTVLSIESFSGGLHSVNADGMTSGNYAIYNRRTVITLQTQHGRVAFTALGSSCVASVLPIIGVGDRVARGDRIGGFQFGGSTVVLLFERDRVLFDDDLLWRSYNRVESLVRVRNRIGRFVA